MNSPIPRLPVVFAAVILGGSVAAWGQAPQRVGVISGQVINVGVNQPPAKLPVLAAPNQRVEREKLAPSVMSPEVIQAAQEKQQVLELAVFQETVKRLSEVEQADPARALTEYRRFLVGRNPSPALGVQVALKVSQMHQKLNDFQGALLTCDVMAKKYAAEPSSALLSLQKARVLMGQKKLAQAAQGLDEAMPNLLALGVQRYVEVSELLLKLVQANLDRGDTDGKERARTLCVDLEEVYLSWLKDNTVDHLRERFQVLQANYQALGAQQRADELFPKISDVLLQLPANPNNGEAGVMSLQMAQWLCEEQYSKSANVMLQRDKNAAFQLYVKAALSSDDFHSGWSIVEGLGRELKSSPQQAQIYLLQLQKEVRTPSARLAIQFLLAWAHYKAGDWDAFLIQSEEALKQYESTNDKSRRSAFASLALQMKEARHWAKLWQTNFVVAEQHDLNLVFDEPLQQPVERRIFVDTPTPTSLKVTVEGEAKRISVRLEASPWAPGLAEMRHQQIVVVTVAPGEAQAQFLIRIVSVGQKGESLQVPLKVTTTKVG